MANKKDCGSVSGFGTYVTYCECLFKNINELNVLLTGLVSSYRLLVGSAEEFNRITLAHKRDLEDAIDRADDLGDVIDKIICRMDRLVSIYLDICFQEVLCPELVPRPSEKKTVLSDDLEDEISENLGDEIVEPELDLIQDEAT